MATSDVGKEWRFSAIILPPVVALLRLGKPFAGVGQPVAGGQAIVAEASDDAHDVVADCATDGAIHGRHPGCGGQRRDDLPQRSRVAIKIGSNFACPHRRGEHGVR